MSEAAMQNAAIALQNIAATLQLMLVEVRQLRVQQESLAREAFARRG